MTSKTKRRLTEAEFEAVRPFLTISDDRAAAARAALVDGTTLQKIADEYGWTRQAVNDSVNAVWRNYERYQESQRATANAGALLPPGWEQVTLIAPTQLIAQFRLMIAETMPQATKPMAAAKNGKAKQPVKAPAKDTPAKKPAAKAKAPAKKAAAKPKAATKKVTQKPRSK